MNPLFSIVICTYNRADLLALTLPTVAAAQPTTAPWELLLIDNNSPDDTSGVFNRFLADHPNINGRYFREENQGLSYARNRGFQEAAGEWIFYLDDDAKADPGLLVRATELAQQRPYDIIGGVYYPWYHFGRPRWFRDSYASNALPYTELTPLRPPHYASGGVLLIHQEVLRATGGFNTEVGMSGDKVAYGEETYLQMAAQQKGFTVGYDPHLRIEHVVMAGKLSVDWFFTSAFARGRDAVLGGAVGRSPAAIVGQLVLGLLVTTKDFILSTPKLLREDYYLENWLIDVFQKMAKRIGSVYTALLHDR